MRENGFDRIEIIAKRREETLRLLRAGVDPESVYTGLYDARRPPTSKEFTLGMKVEVESLRLEFLLLQALLAQLLPQ